MTEHSLFPTPALIDPQRLHAWFPVAELGEVLARRTDSAALIDYLSRSNDLTPGEVAEMLGDLPFAAPMQDGDGALRAA